LNSDEIPFLRSAVSIFFTLEAMIIFLFKW